MDPQVTIAILTYRRPEHLARALASAIKQRGARCEIVVVDNAGEDSVRRWLAEQHPGARYYGSMDNSGCAGRNLGLREARAPVVITIDDDVELCGDDCAARVAVRFERQADLACLNFKVVDIAGATLEREWCHPRPIEHADREFETYFILEGACALRRDSVLGAGGYPADFFLGHEGIDLAYRLIDRGLKILHTQEISAVHRAAAENRPGSRMYYYYTRNSLLFCYRNLPAFDAIAAATENTLKMAFFALRAGQTRAHLRGFADGLTGLASVERHPIGTAARERIRAMESQRPSMLRRMRRHLRERIL